MFFAVKVNDGRAEIYDASNGSYQRSVGSDVVTAQVNGNVLQITKKDGSVEIYDANNGSYQRSL